METIQNLDVTELSHKEMCEINGGDQFTRELGYILGRAGRGLWNFITSGNNNADETLMNCI